MASAPVFENDESRWLVGARGHSNQAAESLVTDPRLVPDVDVEPGVAGDNTDPIRELLGEPAPGQSALDKRNAGIERHD